MLHTSEIIFGHTLEVLRSMPSNSVHCVVTSPPYWGLRDYAVNSQIWGGNPQCDHIFSNEIFQRRTNNNPGNKGNELQRTSKGSLDRDKPSVHGYCRLCGAWRGCLGLEPSPTQFVQNLTEVFSEVYRVLRPEGTLWLNLGDSYTSGKGQSGTQGAEHQNKRNKNQRSLNHGYQTLGGKNQTRPTGDRAMLRRENLKPKDLVGIPWRVAFALQDAGWYLRQDIIWHKPNPMPESVKDRCTKSHEYIFLLTKSEKYYFDNSAITESANFDGRKATEFKGSKKYAEMVLPSKSGNQSFYTGGHARWQENDAGELVRNKRSVWTVPTQCFPDAHFATFSEKLIEPCILAGTSEYGACANCGEPYLRTIQKALPSKNSSRPQIRRAYQIAAEKNLTEKHFEAIRAVGIQDAGRAQINYDGFGNNTDEVKKLAAEAKDALGGYFREFLLGVNIPNGWQKSCNCETDEIKPCVVLDPFSGAATTGVVALKNNRSYKGIELNPDYIKIGEKRLRNLQIKLF